MLFTSTALVPRQAMPTWLAAISRYNPLSLAVDAWRGALVLGELPRPLPTIAVLATTAVLLFGLALTALRRPLR